MKTAISVPDDVFAEAERLAKRLRKPRSKLYSDAIAEYVSRHDPDLVTAKLNEVWGRATAGDEFVGTAARRVLERTDW
ncbi:MAG: hypothetical protein FJ028_04855 [Chloroflexi bacterium]|nr:hypothetical protein [Chloroflexota bacterium]